MTREEFNTKVEAQFKTFEEKEMAKSKEQIFNDSYEIAKMTALKDYLTENYDGVDEEVYPYAETILIDLFWFECNYDFAMWASWDDISEMLGDFIETH